MVQTKGRKRVSAEVPPIFADGFSKTAGKGSKMFSISPTISELFHLLQTNNSCSRSHVLPAIANVKSAAPRLKSLPLAV